MPIPDWRIKLMAASDLRAMGELDRAAEWATEAVQIVESKYGRNDMKVVECSTDLALIYKDLGLHSKAEQLHLRMLAIREKKLGFHHPDLAINLASLAFHHGAQGHLEVAVNYCERVLEFEEGSFGADHQSVALSIRDVANILCKSISTRELGVRLYQLGLKITEKNKGSEHSDVAVFLAELGECYRSSNQIEKAEELLVRSLRINEKVRGPSHPEVAMNLLFLAGAFTSQGKSGAAETLLKRAIAIVEKSQPPSKTLLATCLNNLGLIYLEGEQFEQSEAVLLRALSIVESEQGPNGPLVYNAIMNLISLYRKTHRDIEANTLGVRAMLIQNH